MQSQRNSAQETAEDIFFGQLVIIYARWFVIVAMVILALWSTSSVAQLVGAVIFIVPLMAINFFVHGRYLMEKPVNKMLLTILSAVDILIITLLIFLWPNENGLLSQFYIFYYPLILAFAFVSVARNSIMYTVFTLVLYTAACTIIDAPLVLESVWLERLTIRLITMAAMGLLGAYYWRIQRSRLRAATGLELDPI
ncbi:MAG: hypothetical protein GWP61_16195 [Chloroflexi bacterium]|jgi:hypothetical protein|nr:hypothetical protein [Chloroflexota bacterium]